MVEFPEPATGPGVWMGRDFAGSDEWITRLTPQNIGELTSALATLEARNIPVQEITAADFPLPGLGIRPSTSWSSRATPMS